MPLGQRSQHISFLENQEQIEKDWDITFGDRKNEIVFIGQEMNEQEIRSHLNACLATAKEIESNTWKEGFEDEWPVERAYAL